MAKRKKKARRTTAKHSRKEESVGKKSESTASSRRSVAKSRKQAGAQKRKGGAPATDVLYPVGQISNSLISELAKVGGPAGQIAPQQLSFPVYGNYCGVGHGDPTGKTPPIDAVDAVCREHDLCYGRFGSFNRRCDRDLIKNMPDAIARTPSPVGKNAGTLALLYFSLLERNLSPGRTLFKGS